MTEPQLIHETHETLKPNSYEFGKPSNRHKIFYTDVEELKKHVESLRALGYVELEE